MGLFDFLKKKKESSTISPPLPPTPPPFPKAVARGVQIASDNPTVKTLNDFFEVDLLTLHPEDEENRNMLPQGKWEMGMFQFIDFHLNPDGTVHNISLGSLSKKVTPEFREFVKICANTFGPTKSGEKELTSRDEFLILQGVFSRMWPDLWIEMGRDTKDTGLLSINITIFNVKKTANTIMKI